MFSLTKKTLQRIIGVIYGRANVEISHQTEWTDRKNRFTICPQTNIFHHISGLRLLGWGYIQVFCCGLLGSFSEQTDVL